jgi:hypothetical protein
MHQVPSSCCSWLLAPQLLLLLSLQLRRSAALQVHFLQLCVHLHPILSPSAAWPGLLSAWQCSCH